MRLGSLLLLVYSGVTRWTGPGLYYWLWGKQVREIPQDQVAGGAIPMPDIDPVIPRTDAVTAVACLGGDHRHRALCSGDDRSRAPGSAPARHAPSHPGRRRR